MTVLLKTLSDNVALFNDNGLYFLEQEDAVQVDKIVLASGLMLLSGIGIFLQPQLRIGFLTIFWFILFFSWVVYFFGNFFAVTHKD